MEKMIHFIGVVCFLVTLMGAILSMSISFTIWLSIILIIFSCSCLIFFQNSKGKLWFILSVGQSLSWLAGSYLFEKWHDSVWSFLTVKFPVLFLLVASWGVGFLVYRFALISGGDVTPIVSKQFSFKDWFNSVSRKKQDEPKNSITFVLGEKVDERKGGR